MQTTLGLAWLIPLMPFAGACIVWVLLISFNRTINRLSKPVSTFLGGCLGISAVLSFALLLQNSSSSLGENIVLTLEQRVNGLDLQIGLIVDIVSEVMFAIISILGIILMVFSHQYMYQKKGYVRFFIYLSLLISSSLGLVCSSNLIEISFFWSLVGIFSYLLRRFWYSERELKETAGKISAVDSLGTLIFIVGVFYIINSTGSIDFEKSGDLLEQSAKIGESYSLQSLSIYLLLFLSPIIKTFELPFTLFNTTESKASLHQSLTTHSVLIASTSIFIFFRLEPLINTLMIALRNTSLVQSAT